MAIGKDPSQIQEDPGKADGHGYSIFDTLVAVTNYFCQFASNRYSWFQPRSFWELLESISTWCSGDCTGEVLSKTRVSLDLAISEFKQVSQTASSEIRNPSSVNAANNRQTRLKAILDKSSPYLVLDERPIVAGEVAVHYIDALIRANGERVSFAEFVRNNPRFQSAVATRVLDALPQDIQRFVERGGKGTPARLKIELLQSAQ